MATWIVDTIPVPTSGVCEKAITLLRSEPEPRLRMTPNITLSLISHVQTSLVPLHLIAGPAVDCISQDVQTKDWLTRQFLTDEATEEAPWWTSDAAQAHVSILLRSEGALVAWNGGPLITEVLLYATVVHYGPVSSHPPTPPPSSPCLDAGEALYAIRIRALPLCQQPEFLSEVSQDVASLQVNAGSTIQGIDSRPWNETLDIVEESETAGPTLLPRQTTSAKFAGSVDSEPMLQDVDAPAIRNKSSLQRAVLTGMRMHGLQQRKRARGSHLATKGELDNAEPLEESTICAQDAEYKNVYHHAYKAAAFALRKPFATEVLRPELLQDVVDRLLILFCNDANLVGTKDMDVQTMQTDM